MNAEDTLSPTVEVLGVYAPGASKARLEQFVLEYMSQFSGDFSSDRRVEIEAELRSLLAEAVLIEVRVRDREERFDVGDFVQRDPSAASDLWQAAWAEVYLTPDGDALACERWSACPDGDQLRIAFWIHFWKEGVPLSTSYGPVRCHQPTEIPERLWALAAYDLPD